MAVVLVPEPIAHKWLPAGISLGTSGAALKVLKPVCVAADPRQGIGNIGAEVVVIYMINNDVYNLAKLAGQVPPLAPFWKIAVGIAWGSTETQVVLALGRCGQNTSSDENPKPIFSIEGGAWWVY